MMQIRMSRQISRSILLLISLQYLFSSYAQAEAVLPLPGPDSELIKKYENFHEEFFKRFCPSGKDHKYSELLKNYRGDGYYVPETANGRLDRLTILEHLPALKNKIEWIDILIARTSKMKRLPPFRSLVNPIKVKINDLLEEKRNFDFAKTPDGKKMAYQRSQSHFRELRNLFSDFTESVPFLLSYGFPVDHLGNRVLYDKLKERKDAHSTRRANRTFFRRKIYEDGAFDPGRRHSDLYLRSTLDSIAIQLKHPTDFLIENLRHDLEWAIDQTEHFLRGGKRRQLARLQEWKERTQSALNFYQELSKSDNKENPVAKKAKATSELREFVYQSHADVYRFLSQQPEWIQAVYALETILTHEVGAGPYVNELDRRDVAQVAINRHNGERFSHIPLGDALYPYLRKTLTSKQIQSSKWLNVLFKEGEFSFTYFFIPSVIHIACPDQSRSGKALRRSNAEESIGMLRKSNPSFKAERYFSRMSMIGKIDMSSVWNDYQAIPQRPGQKSDPDKATLRALTRNKFRYFYRFNDPQRESFIVVEIFKNPAVISSFKNPEFYSYRNPHAFTFFQRKN